MRTAVAIGGARGWQDELSELLSTGWEPDLWVACNDAGTDLRTLDHWCSLHPVKLVEKNKDHPDNLPWTAQRDAKGWPREYVTWSHGSKPKTDRMLTGWSDGSSGLLTVGVALHVGAEQVVCCGIRMDREPNAYRPEKQWQKGPNYRRGWNRTKEALLGRVYSMAGWTRRQLGAPPWLSDQAA